MNEAGLVFWLLVVASLCCAVIAVGLIGAVVHASGLEADREREREEPN